MKILIRLSDIYKKFITPDDLYYFGRYGIFNFNMKYISYIYTGDVKYTYTIFIDNNIHRRSVEVRLMQIYKRFSNNKNG